MNPKTYITRLTTCDPTLEGCQLIIEFAPLKSKLDAYADCRHYSKQFGAFGSVYNGENGESLFEIDWTDPDDEEF